MKKLVIALAMLLCYPFAHSQSIRESGIKIGILTPGRLNAITDVPGVKVGHRTLIQGTNIRTGATAIIPGEGNIFQNKLPAAIYIHNGFGKLAGYSQVEELGNIETPIILTNTLSVPTAMQALIRHTLDQPGNENVRSVNAVVGETNDGYLNDIRGLHLKESHVMEAINNTTSGPVAQGNVGAGTGTVCFGYKGGIGTSSRVLPESLGGYTVGVLVQANFGGVLEIAGVPIGVELDQYILKSALEKADGSCMVIVITNAPLDARNLKRLAKRASMGIAKTGGVASNGSGDYVIAISNNNTVRVPYNMQKREIKVTAMHNDAMTPLFLAAIEATEEAIVNALFHAEDMTANGHTINALPKEETLDILGKYGRIKR